MKKSDKLIKFILMLACITGAMSALPVSAENPVAPKEAVVQSGNARFTILTPEMIRIEYSDKGVFEDRATFTIQNRVMESIPSFTTSEDNDFLYIATDKLNLKYRKGTNPKTLPASSKNLIITLTDNVNHASWYPGKPDPLNLKGTCRTLDNSNGDNKREELENGLISRSGWAVIDDSWTITRPDGSRSYALAPDDTMGYDWWTERKDPHALDLYFLGYGSNYKKAIYDYTQIAGKIPLPPAYVFGYWYSKYASYSADDYREIMSELASNKIPTDVMILDMDWHWNGDAGSQSAGIGGWTGWSWNTNLIPQPKELLSEIHDNNFRVALNLHPADGIDNHESPQYFNLMNADLNGKYNKDGKIQWSLDFTDFTKTFFKNIIRDHESEGVDFWWLDWQQHLTSPFTAGLGETFWCNHVFFNDMNKNRPDRRPVIFHRWGGLGSHRYQIGFSGDACINFPTLAFQPYFTATASNVAYTYWGHDLGGHIFTDSKTVNDPELVLRWIQFGVFTPIFRTHATKDDRIERRIWKFPNFDNMLKAVNLRYSLFPYIYTMARETYETGIGLCRPLYYDYPECEEAYKYEGEYMFGNDILVAPITEPASQSGVSTKEIWFPKGHWWSVSTNEMIEGPCIMAMDFHADQIPYFYREGAVIPLNEDKVMNVTAPYKTIALSIVRGKEGTASLYEDQGDNSDYEDVYATTIFKHNVNGDTEEYIIEPRTGNSKNLINNRKWIFNIFSEQAPAEVTLNNRQGENAEWSYDAEKNLLTVKTNEIPCSDRTSLVVKYSGSSVNTCLIDSNPLSVTYDPIARILSADLGERRKSVNLTLFNMAGTTCLNKTYTDVNFVSEDMSIFPGSMYICQLKMDNRCHISKFLR